MQRIRFDNFFDVNSTPPGLNELFEEVEREVKVSSRLGSYDVMNRLKIINPVLTLEEPLICSEFLHSQAP